MRKCVQGMYNIINGIFAALWAASLPFKGIRPEILKYSSIDTQSINRQKNPRKRRYSTEEKLRAQDLAPPRTQVVSIPTRCARCA
jgi:hypothetical protein